MAPEQWQHVCALFDLVLALPVDERRAFIDALQEESPAVRSELTSLLDEHEDDTPSILSVAFDIPEAPADHADAKPNAVTRYYAELRHLGRSIIRRITGNGRRQRQ
ncbi:MAG: hypothetical protein AAFX85_08725 [Pseudomonadota bacterium]